MEYNNDNEIETEDKFNTGNLSTDIDNLKMEIRKLTFLKETKEKMKRYEERDKKIDFEKTNTIKKVNRMISDNKQVEFERHLHKYTNYIYGLKKFYILLSISVNNEYQSCDEYVNYSSGYMEDKMIYNMHCGNNSFGVIYALCPYESQTNVTQTEYEHAVNYLQNILPIHVTINRELHEDCIKFNTGYEHIYVDSSGHAYICGVSLTNR
jgi:hypothetical protein